MDQHQAVKAEALELKCEVCGNLISTSSDGSSCCLPCQGNLKRKELKYGDHMPYLKRDCNKLIPPPCPNPKRRILYRGPSREDYKNMLLRFSCRHPRNKVIDACLSSQDEVQADKPTLASARQDGAAGLDFNMGGASV